MFNIPIVNYCMFCGACTIVLNVINVPVGTLVVVVVTSSWPIDYGDTTTVAYLVIATGGTSGWPLATALGSSVLVTVNRALIKLSWRWNSRQRIALVETRIEIGD